MEILNQRNIIGRTMVREKFTIYERILYSDKTVEWNPISYAGECDEEELEKKFQDLINKPVETTNEQPNEKYDLQTWFEDQIEESEDKYGYTHKRFTPLVSHISKKEVSMLFCGAELTLNSNGTYIIVDTTGG